MGASREYGWHSGKSLGLGLLREYVYQEIVMLQAGN